LKVGTSLDFDSQKVVLVLEKEGKRAIIEMQISDLDRVFDTLDNPLARQVMRLLGWAIRMEEAKNEDSSDLSS